MEIYDSTIDGGNGKTEKSPEAKKKIFVTNTEVDRSRDWGTLLKLFVNEFLVDRVVTLENASLPVEYKLGTLSWLARWGVYFSVH